MSIRDITLDTYQGDYSRGWAANITTQAGITAIMPQATQPAGVDNEICVIGGGRTIMEVQLWCGTSGGQLDCSAWGWRWSNSDKLWMPRLLVQFRTTARNAGLSILGDTLYPPLSHVININNANAVALDGSDTWKVPGCLQFDSRGSKWVSFRVNPVAGTPKANLWAAIQ